GKFNAEAAKELNIPLKYWSRLQKGEEIDNEDGHFTPDMVMGPPRRGLKLTYTTDSRPCENIREAAADADLFVCEGMYGDDEKQYAAALKKHMTFSEAAQIAAEAQPKQMWLTHYSPSEQNAEYWMEQTRNIFPETYPGFDGKSCTLKFDAD
ncbi:MAG TPA: ribonuclease Z, partial [Erysipelotrichaceae bacterium]|nr:ribonuclease Z [Erysipelotrichaceae bacterium]